MTRPVGFEQCIVGTNDNRRGLGIERTFHRPLYLHSVPYTTFARRLPYRCARCAAHLSHYAQQYRPLPTYLRAHAHCRLSLFTLYACHFAARPLPCTTAALPALRLLSVPAVWLNHALLRARAAATCGQLQRDNVSAVLHLPHTCRACANTHFSKNGTLSVNCGQQLLEP